MAKRHIDFAKLATEQPQTRYRDLDGLNAKRLVDAIHNSDQDALRAVGRAQKAIAAAVELITSRLSGGGRLIYIGAGTSGRLGLLDAAECPPTFSTAPGQVLGLLAGGKRALDRAVEGAEDSLADGRAQLAKLNPGPTDVVCGISASGVTPFVWGGLKLGRKRKSATVLVSSAPAAQIDKLEPAPDIVIALDVGPEIIAGSTRMKAGLATKAVLHTLTTAAMIRLGKVYDNLMVDVRPTSRKLQQRATRIVSHLTGLDAARAQRLLRRSGDNPKLAVVMHHQQVNLGQARELLRNTGGHLRPLIGDRVEERPGKRPGKRPGERIGERR